MRGQGMPVSDEKETLIFMLQLHPVFQHAMIVPEVQSARRPHAG
jgi:hypothetical protein